MPSHPGGACGFGPVVVVVVVLGFVGVVVVGLVVADDVVTDVVEVDEGGGAVVEVTVWVD
ncbi:MAG: hypothetical protein WEA76_09760 [Acidimicrobiia bacterium]